MTEEERWIVKDLGEQGRNVNNWHWTEQKAEEWVKERLVQELCNIDVIQKDKLSLRTGSELTCTGEATVTNRKGKLRVFYELRVILNWSGELRDTEGNVIGKIDNSKIEFPELSEDQTDDEFVMKLAELENPTETTEKIWRLMKKGGLDVIKKRISIVLKELRAGGKWNPNSTKVVKDATVKPKIIPQTTTTTKSEEKQQVVKPKKEISNYRTLEFTETFRAPPSEIYDCLMNEQRFQFFTRSGASIPKKENEKFTIFSGAVEGVHLELVQNKKIVQNWRFKDWEDGHYSHLTIQLVPKIGDSSSCELKLTQKNIPLEDKNGVKVFEKVQDGWKQNIFQGIRKVFNF